MSPSVAVQDHHDQPASIPHGLVFAITANTNAKKRRPSSRRKQVSTPLPPRDVQSLSQRIQAADEAWQDLWQANMVRSERNDRGDDAALLVAFSRVIHAVIDDRDVRGLILNYFDDKLQSEARGGQSTENE